MGCRPSARWNGASTWISGARFHQRRQLGRPEEQALGRAQTRSLTICIISRRHRPSTARDRCAPGTRSIVSAAGGGGTIIAYGTRTPNLVFYESPSWGGFDITAAYSANPGAASEADLGSTTRKGRGFNVVPRYMTQDWGIVYSYWDAKHDASPVHQRADRVWGFYKLRGLRIGAALRLVEDRERR